MIYKNFQGIKLSRLGMGNMRLPVRQDVEGNPIDYDKAQEIIDYAMANGINYYDTAYVYHGGESEKFVGHALAKYDRSSFYVATKFLYSANHDYKAVFEEQLSRLNMDYIDFYLIHALGDDSCNDYINSGCIEYFLEQKKNGRIKYLGFSSHSSTATLEKFVSHHNWDFTQIQLNYYDWMFGSTKEEYRILEEHNIPIIVMEPVRGGRLATLSEKSAALLKAEQPDWTIPSWAFRFIKSLPQVQVVLSGMSNMDQIKDNVATFSDERALDEDETKILMQACTLFRDQLIVPCTGCRYCCDGCPAKINIPLVLDVYNRFKTEGEWALNALKDINSKGKPSDCIACGACSSHCPQGIDIPKIMNELVKRGY